MRKLIRATATVLVAAAAVGSLSLVGGVAGAATPPAHHAATHKHKHHRFSIATFKCTRADRVLVRIQHAQKDIAAGLPNMTVREEVAQSKGHTVRAKRIERRIKRRESPKFKAFLVKATSAIEAKCHVSAPPVVSSPAAPAKPPASTPSTVPKTPAATTPPATKAPSSTTAPPASSSTTAPPASSTTTTGPPPSSTTTTGPAAKTTTPASPSTTAPSTQTI